MILNKKTVLLTGIICTCFFSYAENKTVVLGDSGSTQLSVDLSGGAFTAFRLTEEPINPFSWNIPLNEMPENNKKGAVFQGHFLCLGRWGSPTEGEIKAGVPHNGQSGNQMWDIVGQYADFLHIRSIAPLDGINVERMIYFDKSNAMFKVTDHVRSTLSVGRLFNIVQHATIGPPFLSSSTIIDCNAGKGFMQHLSYPEPHRYEYSWPDGIIDSSGTIIDLTRTDIRHSYVSTHLFDETTGWVTASSPDCGLLIGYIWKTNDYPWINIWHEIKDGKPHAKGLEFGTCGIGRSYQDLLATDTRFHGRNSFFFLDALADFEKSFICFQVKIPNNFRGVKDLKIENGQIILIEKESPANRKIVIENYKFDIL